MFAKLTVIITSWNIRHIIIPHTLNLNSALCQVYLNKTGRKKLNTPPFSESVSEKLPLRAPVLPGKGHKAVILCRGPGVGGFFIRSLPYILEKPHFTIQIVNKFTRLKTQKLPRGTQWGHFLPPNLPASSDSTSFTADRNPCTVWLHTGICILFPSFFSHKCWPLGNAVLHLAFPPLNNAA